MTSPRSAHCTAQSSDDASDEATLAHGHPSEEGRHADEDPADDPVPVVGEPVGDARKDDAEGDQREAPGVDPRPANLRAVGSTGTSRPRRLPPT
jgi:hypothetical protein